MSMLTTIDNPFDPYTEWDQWLAYDAYLGHHTPSYLARIVVSSEDLSIADQVEAIESAIDEIINEDELKLYKKLEDPKTSESE